MNMRVLLVAAFAGLALAGGAPAEAASIGAAFRQAVETPSAMTPVRRVGRRVGSVVRRAAPVVGRVARAAGKL